MINLKGTSADWTVWSKSGSSWILKDKIGRIVTAKPDGEVKFSDGSVTLVKNLSVQDRPENDPNFVGYVSWDDSTNKPTGFSIRQRRFFGRLFNIGPERSKIWPNAQAALDANDAALRSVKAVYIK